MEPKFTCLANAITTTWWWQHHVEGMPLFSRNREAVLVRGDVLSRMKTASVQNNNSREMNTIHAFWIFIHRQFLKPSDS